MAEWPSGQVAEERSGPVAQWPSGQVAAERSGPVAKWPSGQVAEEVAVNRGANIDSNSNSNSNSNSQFIWPGESSQVWAQVQAMAAQKAPLVWVGNLLVIKAEKDAIWLGPMPGHRDIMKFVASQKNARDQLNQLFRQVIGLSLRIEWQTGDMGTSSPAMPSAITGATAPAFIKGNELAGAAGQGGGAGVRGQTLSDRQAAMGLPLVRQMMQLFDATIVDVRQAQEPTAPAEAAASPDEHGQGDGTAIRPTVPGFASDARSGMGIEDSPFTDEDEDV